MITQHNQFLKRGSQLTALAMLTILMVISFAQVTLAIPLDPILDRIGRSAVEGAFSADSASEATPEASQTSTNTQEEVDSSPETPEETGSLLGNPTYPPQAYPHNYPPYPPQVYLPSYPPYPPQVYPSIYPQTYPSPVYLLPSSVPSGQSSIPLIINNVNH